MIALITGGSKCGKSTFAEELLDGFAGRKIYVATMRPFGEDAREAIERHRRSRAGKGFEAVEKYSDIGELSLEPGCAVLLECLGNLVANELFSGEETRDPADKIVAGLKAVAEKAAKLVIVTNQVGSDGISYPEGTSGYVRALGEVNRRAAELADAVFETVYGVPVALKGELIW